MSKAFKKAFQCTPLIVPVVLFLIFNNMANEYLVSCGVDRHLLKQVPISSFIEPSLGRMIMLQHVTFAFNETIGRTLWMQEKLPNFVNTTSLAYELAVLISQETSLDE